MISGEDLDEMCLMRKCVGAKMEKILCGHII